MRSARHVASAAILLLRACDVHIFVYEKLSFAFLFQAWPDRNGSSSPCSALETLLGQRLFADVDPFDRVQLAEVVRVCRGEPSLSAAGRALFSASRARKASSSDADRLRKRLARFALDWETVRAG